ncbi:MAG: sugar phosphate isomerase/epimerase family protein [Candidatus Methylacidiphilaceae bacterium]
MEIGLSTGVFYSKPAREVLPLIARAGFSSIELWTGDPAFRTPFDWRNPTEVKDIQIILSRLDLAVASFHAPSTREVDPSVSDPALRESAVALLIQAIRAAAVLRARILVLHGSASELAQVPEGARAARLTALRDSLSVLHQAARSEGIALAVETLLPHLLTADPNVLLELVAPYPKQEVGICFDTGHCFLWRSWPLESLYRLLASRVIALHVNDNRGTTDDHLPPGEGKIGWRRWLAALRRSAFSGVFLLEAVLPQDTPDPVGALAKMRKDALTLLEGKSSEATG